MQSYRETEGKEELPVKTEKVVLPEGTIEFELDEEEHLFDVGEVTPTGENFTQAEKAGNLSGPSSHNSASFPGRKLAGKGASFCPAGTKEDRNRAETAQAGTEEPEKTEKPAAKKEKSERQVRLWI